MLDQFKSASSLLFIIVINMTLMITVALLIKCSSNDNVNEINLLSGYGAPPSEKYLSKRVFFRFNPMRPPRGLVTAPATKPKSPTATTAHAAPSGSIMVNKQSSIRAKLATNATATAATATAAAATTASATATATSQLSGDKTAIKVANSTREAVSNFTANMSTSSSKRSIAQVTLQQPPSPLPESRAIDNNGTIVKSLNGANSSMKANDARPSTNLIREFLETILLGMHADKSNASKNGTRSLEPNHNNTHSIGLVDPIPASIVVDIEAIALANKLRLQQEKLLGQQHLVVIPGVVIPPKAVHATLLANDRLVLNQPEAVTAVVVAAAAAAAATAASSGDITENVLNERMVDDIGERLSVGGGGGVRSRSSKRTEAPLIGKRAFDKELVEYKVNDLADGVSETDGTKKGKETISSLIKAAAAAAAATHDGENNKIMGVGEGYNADLMVVKNDKLQKRPITSVFSFNLHDSNNSELPVTKEQFNKLLSKLNETSLKPSLKEWLHNLESKKVMSFMHFG